MKSSFLRATAFGLLLAALLTSSAFAAMPQLNLRLEKLEEALNLKPGQKEQYDAAVGATKRMLLQLAMAGLQAKQKLAEELAKPRPDFGVLWELREAVVEDGRSLRREAGEEWRKLYVLLDDDQVATLKRFIQDQANQAGLLHDFMMQLMLGPDR
jgi:hypothetical protein